MALSGPHRLYRLAMRLLVGPLRLWLWWRGAREPGYRQGWHERQGRVSPQPGALGGLWLHTASVGEAQAALALWPALQAQWGAHAITWTTQTPAGRALVQERTGGQVQPWFAPLDTPAAVRRFLSRLQPRMLLLLERELWPEWLWQCQQQAVAVVLVNARLTQRSAARWPTRSRWMQQHLHSLAQVLCADAASAQRFLALGVPAQQLHTTGNLKFEPPAATQAPLPLPPGLAGRLLLVAASTHANDEATLRAGWPAFAARHPKALLLLAPRHPQRFDQVAQQWQDLPMARRSRHDPIDPDTQVLLLDTMGELACWYRHATLCLMGGTWADVGGHNALEALGAGCPVLFGPHVHQFPELYEAMAQQGVARPVAADRIWAVTSELLDQPHQLAAMQQTATTFVAAHQGVAQRTLAQLQPHPYWPRQPMAPVVALGNSMDHQWHDSALAPALPLAAFDPATYANRLQRLATGSGRGDALRVHHAGQIWVLRHYRRGGWVARFNPDRYKASATEHSRAMREFTLLREMRSMGMPVPRPVAARCARIHSAHGAYRADILVECIPHSRNLAQWLDTQPLPAATWQAVGIAIAQMHAHAIDHTDLNCHNLLLDDAGQVWLVDFDKCARRPGQAWQAGNLARLLRSLRKESLRRPGFQWRDSDWEDVMKGYRGVST